MSVMILRNLRIWLWAAPISLLPVFPAMFAALSALVGSFSLFRKNVIIPRMLLFSIGTFVVLGLLSEVLAPPHPLAELKSTAPRTIQESITAHKGQNLFDWKRMIYLQGWNSADGSLRAKPLVDGFWRVPRLNPKTGNPYSEIFIEAFPQVQAGQSYTQSFYFRHDGKAISFQISFFTKQGHHLVPVTVEEVEPGLWRAYATFRFSASDEWVRPINLVVLGGDWSYLDLGYVQLEVGSSPTSYIWPQFNDSLSQRVGWWVGVALLGLLTAIGSQFLLHQAKPGGSVAALMIGMLIHICMAFLQYLDISQRVSGVTLQPNLMGHSAVVVAAVIVALWPKPLSGLAVTGSLAMVMLSGSRTAFVAWGIVATYWFIRNLGRGRWRWFVYMSLLIVPILLGLLLISNRLSKLGNLLNSMLEVRYEIWKVAYKAFLSHPITGIGHGRFSDFYILNHPEGVIEPLVSHAHNLTAHILAETGLMGLIGFAVLYGYVFIVVMQKRAWGALLVLVVTMLLNLGDYSFFNDYVYYPVWFALGSALIYPKNTTHSVRMPQ